MPPAHKTQNDLKQFRSFCLFVRAEVMNLTVTKYFAAHPLAKVLSAAGHASLVTSPQGDVTSFRRFRLPRSVRRHTPSARIQKRPLQGLFLCAGGGNRNLDYCLEGSRFTTKLRPQITKRIGVYPHPISKCSRCKLCLRLRTG